jgi:hypothetical protein
MGWFLQAFIAAGVASCSWCAPPGVKWLCPAPSKGTVSPARDGTIDRCLRLHIQVSGCVCCLPVAPLLDELQISCAVLTTQSYDQSHAMAAGTVDVVAGPH